MNPTAQPIVAQDDSFVPVVGVGASSVVVSSGVVVERPRARVVVDTPVIVVVVVVGSFSEVEVTPDVFVVVVEAVVVLTSRHRA